MSGAPSRTPSTASQQTAANATAGVGGEAMQHSATSRQAAKPAANSQKGPCPRAQELNGASYQAGRQRRKQQARPKPAGERAEGARSKRRDEAEPQPAQAQGRQGSEAQQGPPWGTQSSVERPPGGEEPSKPSRAQAHTGKGAGRGSARSNRKGREAGADRAGLARQPATQLLGSTPTTTPTQPSAWHAGATAGG
jgi:hypothetical protein